MNTTAALPVVGIDVANTVFQLAVADGAWRVTEEHRLTRTQMERWFANRAVGLVVMEACGSAHHWGRWLTPKERSPGEVRHLGRISKRGDRYLRMLLTNGARSVLHAAARAAQGGRNVDTLRRWALDVQRRTNHNKAACALANKLMRICDATLRDGQTYGEPVRRPNKKIERTSFEIAA